MAEQRSLRDVLALCCPFAFCKTAEHICPLCGSHRRFTSANLLHHSLERYSHDSRHKSAMQSEPKRICRVSHALTRQLIQQKLIIAFRLCCVKQKQRISSLPTLSINDMTKVWEDRIAVFDMQGIFTTECFTLNITNERFILIDDFLTISSAAIPKYDSFEIFGFLLHYFSLCILFGL